MASPFHSFFCASPALLVVVPEEQCAVDQDAAKAEMVRIEEAMVEERQRWEVVEAEVAGRLSAVEEEAAERVRLLQLLGQATAVLAAVRERESAEEAERERDLQRQAVQAVELENGRLQAEMAGLRWEVEGLREQVEEAQRAAEEGLGRGPMMDAAGLAVVEAEMEGRMAVMEAEQAAGLEMWVGQRTVGLQRRTVELEAALAEQRAEGERLAGQQRVAAELQGLLEEYRVGAEGLEERLAGVAGEKAAVEAELVETAARGALIEEEQRERLALLQRSQRAVVEQLAQQVRGASQAPASPCVPVWFRHGFPNL